MAQHLRWLKRPSTALRLHDLALSQLPADRRRFTVLRAVLATRKVEDGLCHLGVSALPEVKSTLAMAFDLYPQASADELAGAGPLGHRAIDMSVLGMDGCTAYAYLVLAREDRRLAGDAEERTLRELANIGDDQGRTRSFHRSGWRRCAS
ncbi:MAG TPA: hypothetical protein VFM54_03475 [Micromonosporaceae bacterium]|nr:hypothetical protein [Micromonosporaceae bacterium]